ncbi:cell division protein FtsQ/DivIB [Testudinibacter aquarius]|uniref:Cell division protein FtsQ n=1 Tax=Testudinibacter aquarius TaxID=1524974 RepID=A0A4V2W1S5_9PAST|nr:cell division protein FtsQ/DivIB [Testudinibacter aquarius]KAE9525333.1 cell division protein FtsQ [Testudinibacter aquarius]TCV85309.1 cell division protein FtsQ [Testudinibacter aquarius]TNG92080.1 FtsQ-type POTRA domain-containing protein [Testudinibacter aquarius]
MAVKPNRIHPTTAEQSGFKFFVPLKSLFVILCLGFGYYCYSHWQNFLLYLDQQPLNSFAVIGQPRYTSYNDIRDSLLQFGELQGYFSQDVESIQQQIELMPWVKGALVRKIWPNKLSIAVAEYSPVAFWNERQLLAADGTIFSLPPEKREGLQLPNLQGNDFQSREVLSAWYQISNALKAKNMTLQSMQIDSRGAWQVSLSNGIELKLGRGEWKQKIERFATIYPQIEVPDNQQIDYVDLRYNSGAAVGFKALPVQTETDED